MEKSPLVITLVHGTFARDAEWTKDGSFLRRQLIKQLGPNLVFHEFKWSGKNSHGERLAASVRLRSCAENIRKQYKSSKHIVITHSHGGNVARYAIRGTDLQKSLAGIVTLSTPFIDCRARQYNTYLQCIRWALPLLMVGCLIALSSALLSWNWPLACFRLLANHGYMQDWTATSKKSIYNFMGIIQVFFPFLPLLWLIFKISAFIVTEAYWEAQDWLEERQKELTKMLRCVPDSEPRMLCVYISLDEALGLLSVTRWAGNMGHYVFLPLKSLLRHSVAIIALLFAFFAPFIALATHSSRLDDWSTYPLGVVLLFILIGAFLQVPILLLPYFSRAHRLSFGGETIIDNWITDITVSAKPLDRGCDTFRIQLADHENLRGFRHSAAYDNESAVDYVCAWIKARL